MLLCGRIADAIRSAESVKQSEVEIRSNPYPHFKSQDGLNQALAIFGDLRRARDTADGLVEFASVTGSARVASLAYVGLSSYWLLALDFERAVNAARSGIAGSKDPLYGSTNAIYEAVALAADLRFVEAVRLVDDWLPYAERSENHLATTWMKATRASADIALGRLSMGMRSVISAPQRHREAGWEMLAVGSEVFLLHTYVTIARRDVKPTGGSLIRNPWFVFTQAPFAARNARQLIDRLRIECELKNTRGYLGLVDLFEGRLLAHQGKKQQAKEIVERIRRRLDEAGVESTPAPVTGLMAEFSALNR